MNEKERLEGNKLIAKFMGSKLTNVNGVVIWDTVGLNIPKCEVTSEVFHTEWGLGNFRFHSSWDWLMPVVIKIGEKYDRILFGNDETMYECQIIGYTDNESDFEYGETGSDLIQLVFEGIVEYIKWYNKNN